MRKLRSLRWLCSLSLVASLLCGVAFGAGIPDLDDLDIDPWGELEKISAQDFEQDKNLTSENGEEVYCLDADAGIMPLALDATSLSMHLEGFAAYGEDEDGDEWEGVDVYPISLTTFDVSSSQGFDFSAIQRASTRYGSMLDRSTQINSNIVPSKKAAYVGRQPILNGDPEITLRTSFNFKPGSIVYDFNLNEPIDDCESFQILDAGFLLCLTYASWTSSTSTGATNNYVTSRIRLPDLLNCHLLVNGNNVGNLEYVVSSKVFNGNRVFYVQFDSSSVSFDKQRVSSASIVFDISEVTWTNGSSKVDESSGGFGVYFVQPTCVKADGSTWWMASVSPDSQFVFSSNPAAENTGLLRSIIEFLKVITSGVGTLIQNIAALPGQIANLILDGLKSLFIPSAEDIENIKAQYLTLLEERLGFLWQAMTFITDTAQKFLTALEGSSDYVFNLPALTITLPSGEFTLVQAQTLDFDNGLMTAVRTAAGTMVSFVVVLGFLNVSEKMVVAIVSGKSYFDYLKGGGEE